MQVTTKSIITEVLSVVEASGHPAVRVSLLIEACAIFGFSANTVRVTLVKMRADGTVAGYIELREQLEDSTARRDELSLEEAMREAFLLGREVIRWVTLDPLLPEQMVPIRERDALVEAMTRYDETGQALWRRYLGVAETEEAA
jgi:DNA-binding transcriptional regulator PaaX